MNNKVKLFRVMRGMQQKELAKQVGVTRQTMSLIESEKYNPTLKLCIKIAQTLGTTLDALFWEDDSDEK